MKILFLGTGSAEGYPSPFCSCSNCKEARSEGGKSLRLRSSLMIDNDLMVDFGPDLLEFTHRYDIHLPLLKTLLITHSHYDHLYLENLNYLIPETGTILSESPKITIVCNETVKHMIDSKFKIFANSFPWQIITAHVFKTIFINNIKITAIPAVHTFDEERALLYIIAKGNTSILIAFDTGMWGEKVWRFISDYNFNSVIIDETMGFKNYRGHLNIKEVIQIKKAMTDKKIIEDNCLFIVTHISHNQNPVHSRLEKIFSPESIIVAYDGLEINI
ncbi:MAG: hypothetical protein J7K04_02500 [Spirochaetales bacterium]|nr:hypothetical protein [Spirochaetales bacterium]